MDFSSHSAAYCRKVERNTLGCGYSPRYYPLFGPSGDTRQRLSTPPDWERSLRFVECLHT